MSKENNEQVELVFLPSPQVREGLRKVRREVTPEEISVRVQDFIKWFKGFKVDSIELSIQFAVKSGEITKLFVSFEGQGGCKIILKPDQTPNT